MMALIANPGISPTTKKYTHACGGHDHVPIGLPWAQRTEALPKSSVLSSGRIGRPAPDGPKAAELLKWVVRFDGNSFPELS
jgi:hypothetical protein